MQKLNDLSRSLTPLKLDGTLIAVIEMSLSSWLVAGIVPGVERQPLKKLEVDESTLLKLLNRWREEAKKAGHRIERIAVAFEAGRDGFWLARWLRARSIEAHVIHASSVAVSREHRRAKTHRLDTELLKRAFLGRPVPSVAARDNLWRLIGNPAQRPRPPRAEPPKLTDSPIDGHGSASDTGADSVARQRRQIRRGGRTEGGARISRTGSELCARTSVPGGGPRVAWHPRSVFCERPGSRPHRARPGA